MRLITFTLRQIQLRPGRTLLTLLGITLGIASVVATRLTIDTVHRAYTDLFAGTGGPNSLEITSPGLRGFDGGFSSSLTEVEGIQSVVPRVQGTVALAGKTGSVPVLALGIDPAGLAAQRLLKEGQAPPGDDECLLERSLAVSLDIQVGQIANLWTATGQCRLELVGLLPARGGNAGAGCSLVTSLATAQRLFGMPGRVNSIEVNLIDAADPDVVRARIADRLPPGLTIQSSGSRGDLAGKTLRSTEQSLACLSIVALLGAGFVILNTLLLDLGQRRHHLALLRSLGTTRQQLTFLLLREMLLLGLAGSVAGSVVGLALAQLLLRAMERFLGLTIAGLCWSAEPFLLGLLLGPGMCLAAAWLPARKACARRPLDELLERPNSSEESTHRKMAVGGALALIVGCALAVGTQLGQSPRCDRRELALPALALVMVGSVLALPPVCRPLLRLAAALLRPFLGLELTLGCRQLERHPVRTSLTVGVLYLALAVAIGFGQSLLGMVQDLQHWYRQTIVSDYLVRTAMPDTSFLLTTAMPEKLGDEIAALDQVAAVDRIAFVPARANGQAILVLARTFAADRPLPLNLQEGEPDTVRQGLLQGDVVLGTGLAEQLGLHAGGTIALDTADGPRELRVAGTATEFAVGGQALYLEWEKARQLLDLDGVHVFLISARAGAAGKLAPVLQEFCQRHNLLLQSNAEMHDVIDRLIGRVSASLWALMALAFVVASLGIVNTLTMNVCDQTRELGLLRALGLKRSQVRRVVLSQALLLATISLVPGVLGGLALAQVIQHSQAFGMGKTAVSHFDGTLIAGSCALATVVTVLAALLPARRAARLPVLRALA